MTRRLNPRADASISATAIDAGLAGLARDTYEKFLLDALAVAESVSPGILPTDQQDQWREKLKVAQDALNLLRKADAPEARRRLTIRGSSGDSSQTAHALDALTWLGRAMAAANGEAAGQPSARMSTTAIWARRNSACAR